MITYKFCLGIGISGAVHEDECTVEELGYSDEEWSKLSPEKQEEELETAYIEWRDNFIDGGWNLKD